jgi:hypothetical protein
MSNDVADAPNAHMHEADLLNARTHEADALIARAHEDDPEDTAFVQIAQSQKPDNQILHGRLKDAEVVIAVFAVYSLRIALVPWLWNGAGLQYFLPVISPVYREGEHWQAYRSRAAILCHVCFGSVMLVLGAMQCDKPLRTKHKVLHRWCGRAYVVCGSITIGSLQILQETVGAGSAAGERSLALAWFVDVTSVLWVVATAAAVVAAICKRFEMHRDFMGLSLALACTPIAQRAISWVGAAPLAITARMIVCTAFGPQAAEARWAVLWLRWGPPGDTLWGDGCVLDTDADSSLWVEDSRARPLLFSPDGYGEGEQLSFALSAWMGFGTMLAAGAAPLLLPLLVQLLPGSTSKDALKMNVGRAQLFETWRNLKEAIQSVWVSDQLQLKQKLGIFAAPTTVLLAAVSLLVGGIGGGIGFGLLTFTFTFPIIFTAFVPVIIVTTMFTLLGFLHSIVAGPVAVLIN